MVFRSFSSFRNPKHHTWIKCSRSIARNIPAHRSFHASQKTQSTLLDTCCSQTHEAICALHDITGLPWAVTLPLTAILLRSTIILPISIWSRRQTQRTVSIRPLIYAWTLIIQERMIQQARKASPSELKKMVQKEIASKRKALYISMGIRLWAPYLPILQLPVWLLVIETIRRMCGAGTGLLAMISRQFDSAPTDVEAIAQTSEAPSQFIETSLSSGGALWFPDLLASDPTLALPFILSTALFTNIKLHQWSDRKAGLVPSVFSRRLDRIMMLLALAIGPLTLHFPTAILVYWIPSALFATAQTALFSVIMPLPPSPAPCKPKYRPYKTKLFD